MVGREFEQTPNPQQELELDALIDGWHKPFPKVVLPNPNDDPLLDRLGDIAEIVLNIPAPHFDLLDEPRWKESLSKTDSDLTRDQLSRCRSAPADSVGGLRGSVSYDPNSPASVLRAAKDLAKPLAKAASRKLDEIMVPSNSHTRIEPPKPLDRLQGPVTVREFLGFPEEDGPLVPPAVKEAVHRAADAIVVRKPQLVSGAAAAVATAVVLSGMPRTAPADSEAGAAAVSNRPVAEAMLQSSNPETVKPVAAKLVNAEVSYVPSRPTHLRSIALDLKVPLKDLVASNPGIGRNQEIPAGTKINGLAQSSAIALDEPVSVDELAIAYGLTPDAVRSVNDVNEDGQIIDVAIIPGRQIIKTGHDDSHNTASLAVHLGLSEVGSRELERINKQAPAGEVVLPLTSIDTEVITDPEIISKLVSGEIIPGEPFTSEQAADKQAARPAESSDKALEQTTELSSDVQAVIDTDDGQPPVIAEQSIPTEPENAGASDLSETSPEPIPTPVPEEVPVVNEKHYRPALPEEKFAAEIVALHDALETALQTSDLGPLNHIIFYSPIFKAYDLPADLQEQGFRYLPDAASLNIPNLLYEFSPNTPSKERVANSQVIALNLLAAYSLRAEINANPDYVAAYGSSCVRFGDLAALKGHKSHNGGQSDLTSVFECNMRDGHSTADGPIFWINKTEGGIDRRITNPRYNFDLDRKVLNRLLNARIGDQPLLKSILYNAPNLGLSGIKVFKNHSHHIHINGYGPGNARLKVISHGGHRPELSPDQLRAMWYLAYAGGDGVVGIGKDLQVEITAEQFQQLTLALEAAKNPAPTPTPQPSPEPRVTEPTPEVSTNNIDLMTVLPQSSDIPAPLIPLIKPSKHFSAIELASQAWAESRFDINARSPAGAKGLTQFMPATWAEYGQDDPGDADRAASPFNPVEALDAQRRLMDDNYEAVQRLLEKGKIKGDARQLAYAAYNAGLGNVRKYGGIPPFKETKNYIRHIEDKVAFYVDAVAKEQGLINR